MSARTPVCRGVGGGPAGCCTTCSSCNGDAAFVAARLMSVRVAVGAGASTSLVCAEADDADRQAINAATQMPRHQPRRQSAITA